MPPFRVLIHKLGFFESRSIRTGARYSFVQFIIPDNPPTLFLLNPISSFFRLDPRQQWGFWGFSGFPRNRRRFGGSVLAINDFLPFNVQFSINFFLLLDIKTRFVVI